MVTSLQLRIWKQNEILLEAEKLSNELCISFDNAIDLVNEMNMFAATTK